MRPFLFAACVAALAAAAPPAASAALSNDELYRFAYAITYPQQCYDASNAVAKMRTQPAIQNDPAQLNASVKAFMACANGPYGQQNQALYNSALYSASAASLLAARHEAGAKALSNATFTRDATGRILGYKRGPSSTGRLKNANTPSMYSTNALRMHNEAVALIESAGGAPAAVTSPAPGR